MNPHTTEKGRRYLRVPKEMAICVRYVLQSNISHGQYRMQLIFRSGNWAMGQKRQA